MPITLIQRQAKVQKVSPSDCALLFGIPLDEASFHGKYNRAREGNFAQSVSDGDAAFAWQAYSALATRFMRFVTEVEDLGVHVYRTLSDENLAACVSYPVVTIASQGRSAEFMPADIVDVVRLQRELGSLDGITESPGDCDPLIPIEQRLAGRLNVMLYARMHTASQGLGAPTRRQIELIRCRAELEEMFPGAFRGGAAVEFSDGFHGLEAVAALFPPGFDGVVDLTICNSLLLGELIRQRCSHVLAIAMGERTRPDLRFPLYLAIMQLLERRADTYENAMTRLQDFFERGRK